MINQHDRVPHPDIDLECTCGEWRISREYMWDDKWIALHEQHRVEMALADLELAARRVRMTREFIETFRALPPAGWLDGAE